MTRRKRWAIGTSLLVAVVALAVPTVVLADPDGSATVRFGNSQAGTEFPPGEHDASFNGEDNLIPRTVVISAGGAVSFDVDGFHQAAIYRAGTTPGDIAVPAFPPNLFVNDATDRLYLGPVGTNSTTPGGTFASPGKYLMLCNVTPHFAFAKMYGWVIVK